MWPERIRPLLDLHGSDSVWRTGVRVLGFPPTWAATGKDLLLIERALKANGLGDASDEQVHD
jgi:hypothetical protein